MRRTGAMAGPDEPRVGDPPSAVGLGLYPDFETAVKGMTRIGQVFEPDPGNREIYDALYERVYRQMYRRLRPLYEEIRDITGYPSPLET